MEQGSFRKAKGTRKKSAQDGSRVMQQGWGQRERGRRARRMAAGSYSRAGARGNAEEEPVGLQLRGSSRKAEGTQKKAGRNRRTERNAQDGSSGVR